MKLYDFGERVQTFENVYTLSLTYRYPTSPDDFEVEVEEVDVLVDITEDLPTRFEHLPEEIRGIYTTPTESLLRWTLRF